ncbi:PmeII family type II restriction endonuclease [Paenibacillus sp. MMO-58]|uniref:PmeII family type II restriction endonuclease n=1 Tax=Paenibacillus sp. MMO-58 TaxID=3081290 RepID=UPI0030162B3E
MIDAHQLEEKIGELLDEFYKRRTDKITGLKLKQTLKRKNPYLYRAIGVQKASEIVEGLLSAYMSSSDEGIFGDAFFEPLAKFVSGGVVSPSEGVDVAIETKTTYRAIAVKSGTSVFNAQSKRRQVDDFKALGNRLRKLQKHFDPIVGYSYGKKKQKNVETAAFRELAGQDFWEEITGDSEFYLKIIRLMKNKPQEHLLSYKQHWDAAVNRFTLEFIKGFCDVEGNIDWEKLVRFNSGRN